LFRLRAWVVRHSCMVPCDERCVTAVHSIACSSAVSCVVCCVFVLLQSSACFAIPRAGSCGQLVREGGPDGGPDL
jgi:hypothetical protein